MGLEDGIAIRRHRPWAGLAAASVLAGLLLCGPSSAARLTAAAGTQAERYGRIVLTFDAAVTVKARISGTVLVVTFSERSPAFGERLAAQMPDYVSVVRRDPDGAGLRLALQRPYRVNVQSAGETTFIDLLPMDWAGLPPPLPPEVVAELFARTQAAGPPCARPARSLPNPFGCLWNWLCDRISRASVCVCQNPQTRISNATARPPASISRAGGGSMRPPPAGVSSPPSRPCPWRGMRPVPAYW